jgi:hypothetical protein
MSHVKAGGTAKNVRVSGLLWAATLRSTLPETAMYTSKNEKSACLAAAQSVVLKLQLNNSFTRDTSVEPTEKPNRWLSGTAVTVK